MTTEGRVNEDLLKERRKCTFDVEELTHFIDGGEQATKDRREVGMYVIYLFVYSAR